MPTRAERAYARAVDEAAAFTAANPIGTPVRYWPGLLTDPARVSTIRSAAWALLSGHAIVKVSGYPGGIALDHVEPMPTVHTEEPLYDLASKKWDKTCPCVEAMQTDPECEWHGRIARGHRPPDLS